MKDDFIVSCSTNTDNRFSIIFGLWLALFFPSSILAKIFLSGIQVQIIMTISALWPLLIFIRSRKILNFSSLSTMQFLLLINYLFFSSLSALNSASPLNSVLYLILTVLVFSITILFCSNICIDNIDFGLKVFVFLMFIALICFALYEYRPGIRLGKNYGVENSNAIAMVAFSVAIVSFVYKSIMIRVLFFIPMLTIIVLTGSRASLLSLFIGLIIIYFFKLKNSDNKYRFLVAPLFILILLCVYFDFFWQKVSSFFELDSLHRGLSSGASGRTVAWQEVWELFLNNPVIGVGFRAHETLLTTSTSAHNGYLSLLAEIGLFGFISAVVFSLFGMLKLCLVALKEKFLAYPTILMGLCSGYIFLCVFERYFFNFGNPASVLFLFSIMLPHKCSKFKK